MARGSLQIAAARLGIAPETLTRRRRGTQDGCLRRRRGRPGHDASVRRAAYAAVREVQRKDPTLRSRRAVLKAVEDLWERDARRGPLPPRRLLDRYTLLLGKARRAARRNAEAAARRGFVAALGNAVWALDGTQLGRDQDGARAIAEVVTEVAALDVVAAEVGPPPSAEEVVVTLDRALERSGGEAPAILMHDNGPENVGRAVRKWCEEHQVIALRNVPHTPRHNPYAERTNGELKGVLDALLDGRRARRRMSEWAALAERGRRQMNERTRRERLSWRTSAEARAAAIPWTERVSREAFYVAACAAVAEATRNVSGARARRLAEREAILTTAERYGLLVRYRGGARRPPPET